MSRGPDPYTVVDDFTTTLRTDGSIGVRNTVGKMPMNSATAQSGPALAQQYRWVENGRVRYGDVIAGFMSGLSWLTVCIVSIESDPEDDTLCGKGNLLREKAARVATGETLQFRISADNRIGFDIQQVDAK